VKCLLHISLHITDATYDMKVERAGDLQLERPLKE
ncbi:hypothetical protein ISN45_Aa03g019790, partial [Arabidopsis thaliana x Arabidopsis arenosa]